MATPEAADAGRRAAITLLEQSIAKLHGMRSNPGQQSADINEARSIVHAAVPRVEDYGGALGALAGMFLKPADTAGWDKAQAVIDEERALISSDPPSAASTA